MKEALDETGVGLEERENELALRLPQGYFGSYHFGPEVARPYFAPLLGPGLKPVTREIESAEELDHPHHRSLFTAYEEANDANNWNELPGHGFTRHLGFLDRHAGQRSAGFTAQGLWTNPQGEPVLTETRRIELHDAGEDVRLLDYEVTFSATHGDVVFGETKEGGVLGLRVNPSMNGSGSGTITNSLGGRGEAECWGKKAAWCDYTGEVEGEVVGIAIFDHPSNPNFPTRWHVRDYGLFATNPFATEAFGAGEPTPFLLSNGADARFRYRIFIHRDALETAAIQLQYDAWVAPDNA